MCEIRPPATLWGTTQVTSLTTSLSTVSNSVSTITKETIITNVIPVETRSYPCTSTATSTPTLSHEPEHESEIEATTAMSDFTSQAQVDSTRPSSSSSSSTSTSERLNVSMETDFLTIGNTPTSTRTRSLATPTMSSTTPLDTSPPSSSVQASTSDTRVSIELSASSIFTDPSETASSLAGEGSPSSSSHSLAAGAIVGIVLASLLAFALLGFGYWLRRTRKDRDNSGDGGDPYWERRFQELESVQSKAKLESTIQSPSDAEGTWRKHLTLNLGSHHPIINRPASRLSQISSFFGKHSPQPSRSDLTNEIFRERTVERDGADIDFSHPTDKWSIRTGRTPRGRPASYRSNQSRGSSNKSGPSRDRISAWPFGVIAASIRGNKGDAGSTRNGSIEGRKGMEWIRTIVSSDSGFGFNLDPDRSPSAHTQTPTPSHSRGLPPPPRSRGVSPMPLTNLQTTKRRSQNSHPSASEDRVLSPNPISPNPPPSSVTHSPDEDSLSPQGFGPSSGYLSQSNSLRRKRVNKGLAVPNLSLARDAISPNLWVDEDIDRSDASHPETDLPPLPTVAPLSIAKRIPRVGPSAYMAGLVSRFSPDSSRASFATTHDGRASIPAPPAEKEVPPGRSVQRETDGDSIATRRYDRSAVTPQLPTLATSNADAFRAEMAEISASTGGDREERVISFHGNSFSNAGRWKG